MTRFGPIFLLASRALFGACAPVDHDPITARDLAAFLPVFARLAPDTPIAPAPGPSIQRVFHPLELITLARNYSLDLATTEDLCFEWPMEALDRDRVLEAMRAALPNPKARIALLETSRYPAPTGRIEFHREDLGAPALANVPTPVVWRGNVVYAGTHRFAIWARVEITAPANHLVATELIREGTPVSPNQIRVESGDSFPVFSDVASSVDQVAGRIALRNMAAGSEIHLNYLAQPPDIKRGDAVSVEVLSGSARLAFTGKSESDGRKGDTISIRNPRSNKVFQARVDGKDRALVDLRGGDIRN